MSMASSATPLPILPANPSPSLPHYTPSSPRSPPPLLPKLKSPTLRSRLSKLCQEGQPLLARQIFDAIPRPATVLWNTIIIGFVCNNMPDEALLFYAQMKSSSPFVKCDSYTYSSTLKACAYTRNLQVGKAVHCHFLRCQSYPSRIVYNSLLNMYSVCLSHPEARVLSLLNLDYSKNDLVVKVFDMMRKRTVVAWNTLIAWYVRTERYVKAVKQFRKMIKLGIKPSPVSFVNIFPAFSSLGDFDNANVIYGMLTKLGCEYANDLFVVSSATFMYSELGRVDFARNIFDNCLEKNTEIWNTMISGLVQNNYHDEAIYLFHQAMESEDAVLDEVTFLSVLAAVSYLQHIVLAEQLHACVIKSWGVLPVILSNALIVLYSRCNLVETSFKIFHRMTERDVVSWNTIISAFVQNGFDEEALMLIYEMQKQHFSIDSVTITSLLSAASNLKNSDIGRQGHAYLIRQGLQIEGMDSYLIDMYAKSNLIAAAKNVFEKNSNQERDQATWNAIISGYTQNGLVEEAFLVLRAMLENNVMPNAVTLASVLPSCNPMGNVDWGKQLHGFSIRCSFEQNVFVGTALIDMYSKSGLIAHAENVFRLIPEKNLVTYTSMILGYGQHGMGESALSLFHSMHESGIKPDAVTLVAVLSACCYSGFADEGLRIFKSMEEVYNIQPTIEHYCCVADILGRVGRVFEAYNFVKALGEEGNVTEIWGSLLGACKIHGEFELAKIVGDKLLEMEGKNERTGYRVLMSNIYAEEGSWEDVDRVRNEMKEKGLRKEMGCSWIDIAGSRNRFVSKDRSHSQSNQIYLMLEDLILEMKHEGYNPCMNSNADEILEVDE